MGGFSPVDLAQGIFLFPEGSWAYPINLLLIRSNVINSEEFEKILSSLEQCIVIYNNVKQLEVIWNTVELLRAILEIF